MVETTVNINVYPPNDQGYHYSVNVGGEYTLTYTEDESDNDLAISFATSSEMESVGKALIRAAQLIREI